MDNKIDNEPSDIAKEKKGFVMELLWILLGACLGYILTFFLSSQNQIIAIVEAICFSVVIGIVLVLCKIPSIKPVWKKILRWGVAVVSIGAILVFFIGPKYIHGGDDNNPMPTPTLIPTPTSKLTDAPISNDNPTPPSTSTPTPMICIVTFDSKGGSSISAKKVDYGEVLGELPKPQKDYYDFVGWMNSGKVVKSITVKEDITLEAIWQEKEKSDWVNEEDVPLDADITDIKWTYLLTETTESSETSLIGWNYSGCLEKVVEEGTFEYADFPETFDKTSEIYKEMYKSKNEKSVSDGAERVILSDNVGGYVYWHYSYPIKDMSVDNRYVGYYRGQSIQLRDDLVYATEFNAFKSTNDYTRTALADFGGGTIYEIKDTAYLPYNISGGTWWWFRFEYHKCAYKDIKKIYQYYRTIEKESLEEVVNGEGISKVEKMVRYRKK